MSKNKRIAPNVIRGGVAIPLGSNYFLMKGRTHREGGIDVGKDLEVEDGELMKVTKNNIKVLSDQPIFNGTSPAEYAINGNVRKRFEKAFRAQERFKNLNGLNDDGTKDGDTDKAIFGKIKQKISNIYWHKLRAPKDYSDEKATLKDGSVTEECAKWSNAELQKQGLSIFGDAWTRSSNKGIKKIYSGYDKSKRPINYDKDEVLKYTLDAADSISRVIDTDKLKHNDIVGLYFRNSPNTKKAYEKGTNGETQTHTGHIVEENGKKYVVHNVHGEVIKNDINDVIGSNHPYGITSVYRAKKLGGNYNQYPSTGKKTKAEMGTMKVDEYGNLIADIEPAVVTGEKRNIIKEMIISELLKDSLKLKRDKTVKTNRIKAELGTQTKPKESIAEIVKRITEESQAASNKLAAKITKFNPPLGNNTIDSRSLFNSKPNTQKVNTNSTTKSASVNTSNNNASNTSSSSSNNKVIELPKVVVQDTKKEMPKITAKATTADPGIIKVQKTNNKPKLLPKLDSSNLTKKAVVGELKVNKETKPVELPHVTVTDTKKEMPKITSKAVTKDPGIIIPKKEQSANTNTLPKIDSSSLTSKAVTKDPGISKPKVQNNKEYLQQKLEEESVLKAKDDTKLQSTITKQSDVVDDDEEVVKTVKTGDKVSFFQANPTFIPNLVSAGINVAGSLISHNINKKFLNSLEEPKAPYLLQPTKLKTRINVKPQVDELRRTVRRYNKYFDKNTASSQTAVGRRLNNEQIFIDAFNQIKGNQENQETSLINQDRTQQHETAKFNFTNYNQWLRDKTNFKNTILEKKAENNTALVQNIAGSATNFIDKENQWKRDMMTIAAISASNPNVSADQLADLGLPYAKYMAQRRKNR